MRVHFQISNCSRNPCPILANPLLVSPSSSSNIRSFECATRISETSCAHSKWYHHHALPSLPLVRFKLFLTTCSLNGLFVIENQHLGSEVAAGRQHLAALRAKEASEPQVLASLTQQVSETAARLAQRETVHTKKDAEQHSRLEELRLSHAFYRERLALRFDAVAGASSNSIRVVMWAVLKENPSREVSFDLQTNSDGTWSLLGSSPVINDSLSLSNLLNRLNLARDELGPFTYGMRTLLTNELNNK